MVPLIHNIEIQSPLVIFVKIDMKTPEKVNTLKRKAYAGPSLF